MKHTYNLLRDVLNIHPKHMTIDQESKLLTVNLTNSSKVVYDGKHLRWIYYTPVREHKFVGTLPAFFKWVEAKLDGKPLL